VIIYLLTDLSYVYRVIAIHIRRNLLGWTCSFRVSEITVCCHHHSVVVLSKQLIQQQYPVIAVVQSATAYFQLLDFDF